MDYKSLGIENSDEAGNPHVKLMFYGDTSTRKTETLLRFFPNVFLADAEGNSDQCVRNAAIPTFLRIKTKDARKIIDLVDKIDKGLVKMASGALVETVGIDSISKLWETQQEAFTTVAEERAAKYHKDVAEANLTMTDWTKAKRPLKKLINRFMNSAIPFLVLIAREKPLYEGEGNEMKKVGVIPDVVRGTDYDMNVVLHFRKDGERWSFTVDKVQGNLSKIFPLGKTMTTFPAKELLEYVQGQDKTQAPEEDDEQVAASIASDELDGQYPKTGKGLMQWAFDTHAASPKEVGDALKAQGITAFDPNKWQDMKQAVAIYKTPEY